MSAGYYAYQYPLYQPAMRMILSITNANPAVVTTTLNGTSAGDHLYITGTIVRLDIPPLFGMPQANQLTGTIVVTSPTTFSIDIDTTLFQPYTVPSLTAPYPKTYGQVVPIGEDNDILTAAVQNVLPFSAT